MSKKNKCKHIKKVTRLQEFKDGTSHVAIICADCGGLVKYDNKWKYDLSKLKRTSLTAKERKRVLQEA
jgi:hypothetical protein